MFAVAYVQTNHAPGYVQLIDKKGKKKGRVRCDDIMHANAACATHDGKFMVAGRLGGNRNAANIFSVNGDSVTSDGEKGIPAGASSIAYDRQTDTYCLKVGMNVHLYDRNFNKKSTVSCLYHGDGTFYQDIGAGGGYIFCCFTGYGSADSENSGKNYIDIYNEATGDYCGTYNVNYGELESCDIVDGELVLLVHISGYVNYIQYTGIMTGGTSSSSSTYIDFTVSSKKPKIGHTWELHKNDISAGSATGALNATATIRSGFIVIDGTLLNGRFRLKGRAKKGKVSGSGWVEKKFNDSNSTAGSGSIGKATYVGVDDKDTDSSRRIIAQCEKWSNSYNPFFNGYGGLCELWIADIYNSAGAPVDGACCAYNHCAKNAHTTGAIPKGALVFSGKKRDGSMYENGHRDGTYCDVCGHWAGHVGIYVGNGMIAGSQIPYLIAVDTWIDMYGYGGWSLR